MQDIATLMGAYFLSEDQGHDINNLNQEAIAEILGSCEKVNITASKTTIVNGTGESSQIELRINEIKSQIEFKDNESEKLILKERLAKLEGGVAILKIGAYSDVELKEKKDRLDDALSATRAAIEEGILPGGGVALLRASEQLEVAIQEKHINLAGDEIYGAKLLVSACKAPLSTILSNAGINFEVVQNEILKVEKMSYGFDARRLEYVDMIDSGIIDPAKVTRTALENAVSIAGMMITTECTLIEIQDSEPSQVKIDA
jgi:chaperonin GroEL